MKRAKPAWQDDTVKGNPKSASQNPKLLLGTDLKRFLRDYKREHRPPYTLAALLQSVEYPINVGSIFRLADSADLAELVLTGITPTPPNPTIDKVGRLKSVKVPWRYEKEAVAAVQQLKADGYHVVAVELTDNAVPYHQYDYPLKTCLVVGHEDHGVTKATLAVCDAAVFLPMYGSGLSMNVHVALSIVVYHVLHTAGGTNDE
jgi:tRNA G18 (ribose-2'-O)-methylase SpoU